MGCLDVAAELAQFGARQGRLAFREVTTPLMTSKASLRYMRGWSERENADRRASRTRKPNLEQLRQGLAQDARWVGVGRAQ